MTQASLVQPSSVVLVSGGARGITAQCVIKLAERAHCKFILLGRSSAEGTEPTGAEQIQDEAALKQLIMQDLKAKGEKPTLQMVQRAFRAIQTRREIKETLEAIKNAGGQAEYLRVDITNRAEMLEKLAAPVKRLGAVNGIIHGAGNLADKLIEKKSVEDYESVFSAKIDGLENLLASVPIAQLDFLVLFSSIVGFYGNVGQADYAMANEILNKTAHRLQNKNPKCQIISIGWGPWDSGMVTPELKKAFEERNVRVIPADAGASILVDQLLPTQSITQVIVGDAPPRPDDQPTPQLRQYEIHRKLSLAENPFLMDHRIGDNPVLPATCAATWVATTCEQLYPNHTFHVLENYKVLKGIVFDENLADEYVLDLKETAKSAQGDIDFDAMIWSLNKNGRKLFNYSLRLKLVKELPPAPIDSSIFHSGTALEKPISGHTLYHDGTLFHGPAFQGVQRVLQVSETKLTMEVNLAQVDLKTMGQFQVQTGNPFIYDAIVQSLLIWAQVYYNAPCLPSYMERLDQYASIPFDSPICVTLEIQSQSETAVVGNLTIQDPQGRMYVFIKGLQGTISRRLNNMIGVRQKP
jgi:NAD(P)-dependent dehydrogenase (short-subunit alcohol dehydrogenase family)